MEMIHMMLYEEESKGLDDPRGYIPYNAASRPTVIDKDQPIKSLGSMRYRPQDCIWKWCSRTDQLSLDASVAWDTRWPARCHVTRRRAQRHCPSKSMLQKRCIGAKKSLIFSKSFCSKTNYVRRWLKLHAKWLRKNKRFFPLYAPFLQHTLTLLTKNNSFKKFLIYLNL